MLNRTERLLMVTMPTTMSQQVMMMIKRILERVRTWKTVMIKQARLKPMLWTMMASMVRMAMPMELIKKRLLMIRTKMRRRITWIRRARTELAMRVQATKMRVTTVTILYLSQIKLMMLISRTMRRQKLRMTCLMMMMLMRRPITKEPRRRMMIMRCSHRPRKKTTRRKRMMQMKLKTKMLRMMQRSNQLQPKLPHLRQVLQRLRSPR
jgi:hypothetical protein